MSDLVKREENGRKGEARTEALLLDRFWVLKRSVDLDGADFLIQIPANNLDDLHARRHRNEPFGVVQAKFFEDRNEVKINKEYVIRDRRPRDEFFAFLHTDDDKGQHIHYFFTAAEIAKEFRERDGFMVFSVTASRDYASYRNRENQTILETIISGMRKAQNKANQEFIDWVGTRLRPARIVVRDPKSYNGDFDAMLQIHDPKTWKWIDKHKIWLRDRAGAKTLPVGFSIRVNHIDIEPDDLSTFSGAGVETKEKPAKATPPPKTPV